MAISREKWIKGALTLLLIVCVGSFAVAPKFYNGAFVTSTFAFAIASCVIFLLRLRPSARDVLFVILGGLFLAELDLRILHYPAKSMAILSLLGLASFLVMAVRAVWASPEDRKPLLCVIVPAVLFMVTGFLIPIALSWTIQLRPKTFDLYLLSFDSSLRIQPSFAVGQWFGRWPWLFATGLLFYFGIPIPLAVVYVGRLIRFKEKAFSAMLAFLIASPVGMLFYLLFPACGPRYLLPQDFPWHLFPTSLAPKLLLEPVAIDGPRNAMPSLHLACVLLAWWYSRGLSWWERAIAFTFVAFTLLATLGIGEHWFADLIVAFPFAVLIQAIATYTRPSKDHERVLAGSFGLGAVLTWLVALRYGSKIFWASPLIPWAFVAATVVLASIRQFKLDKPANLARQVEDTTPGSAGVNTSESLISV
jgi:PAP2 superfamily